jgi:hypothetical protein
MFRVRTILAVAAVALTLAVNAFAPAPARADRDVVQPSTSPVYWYNGWEGYQYKCNFGGYKGILEIEHVSPAPYGGGSYDTNCCYWTGYFYKYDQHGNRIGSYPCKGYAKKGSYCYFKVEGSYDWVCMGRLSHDLKKMSGELCDFDHCGYGQWYCEYYDYRH